MVPGSIDRSSVFGGRSIQRLAVVLGAVALLAGTLLVSAGRPDPALATFSSQLSKFKITTIGSQVAGTAFQVVVEAQDAYGNKIKSYPGTNVVLSGLANSPGGNAPVYGAGSWYQGVGTYSVTAFKATTAASITVKDTVKNVSKTSNAFAVAVGPKTLAFTTQPVDTKVGAVISSSLTSATPVKVLAVDIYGNLISGLNVTITTSVGLGGTTAVATGADGIAVFGTLTIGTTGTYSLTATAGSVSTVSDPFSVVDDLAVCDGTTCQSTASFGPANAGQSANSTITTGGDFDNTVVLTTTFGDASAANCVDDSAVFGKVTEVRVEGAGVGATAPSFRTILIYPKETLEALGFKYRLADTFDVCLGATWLGAPGDVDPWRAKKTSTSLKFADAVPDGDGVYWGWAASCLFVSQDDPCIVVRARTVLELKVALGMTSAQVAALGFETGDLAVVVRKPWPWDGKFGMK